MSRFSTFTICKSEKLVTYFNCMSYLQHWAHPSTSFSFPNFYYLEFVFDQKYCNQGDGMCHLVAWTSPAYQRDSSLKVMGVRLLLGAKVSNFNQSAHRNHKFRSKYFCSWLSYSMWQYMVQPTSAFLYKHPWSSYILLHSQFPPF